MWNTILEHNARLRIVHYAETGQKPPDPGLACPLQYSTRIQYSLTHDGDNVVDVTPEAIVTMHKSCTREALRGARNPSRSTSPTSNLIDDAKTSAYAEFVDYVGSGVVNFLGEAE